MSEPFPFGFNPRAFQCVSHSGKITLRSYPSDVIGVSHRAVSIGTESRQRLFAPFLAPLVGYLSGSNGGLVLTVLYLWRRNLLAKMLAHWIADGAALRMLR
jgi:membrane protease YdiL (CAAX protease family)